MSRTDQSGPNELPVFVAGSLPAARPLAQNAGLGQTPRPYGILDQLARCQYRHANRKKRDDPPANAFRWHSTAITTVVKSP
jgi:hypothetical protein